MKARDPPHAAPAARARRRASDPQLLRERAHGAPLDRARLRYTGPVEVERRAEGDPLERVGQTRQRRGLRAGSFEAPARA